MSYLDNVALDYCLAIAREGASPQIDSTFTTVADLAASGNDLQWYADSSLTIPIADTTSLQDSTYYYVTQNIDGCESDALAILYLKNNPDGVSIGDVALQQVKIFPNPTTGIVHLQALKNMQRVAVLSIDGRTVLQADAQAKQVDLSGLINGIYILEIEIYGVTIHHKVVKE